MAALPTVALKVVNTLVSLQEDLEYLAANQIDENKANEMLEKVMIFMRPFQMAWTLTSTQRSHTNQMTRISRPLHCALLCSLRQGNCGQSSRMNFLRLPKQKKVIGRRSSRDKVSGVCLPVAMLLICSHFGRSAACLHPPEVSLFLSNAWESGEQLRL